MFNVNGFCNEITITQDNQVLIEWKQIFQATSVLLEDAYLARAYFWGVASSMENQIAYLGGNYIPNLERRVNNLEGNGVLSEGDLRVDWVSNEDQAHVNEDVAVDDQIADLKVRINQGQEKMVTAAIGYVLAVQEHDDISKTMDQLTFSGIKARAADKRKTA